MKKATINYTIASLLFLVFGCPLSGCAEPITPDQIQSHFKSISAIDGYVFVHGRWKKTSGNIIFNKPPRINTVSLTCDKETMTCKEIIAELVTPQEVKGFEKPQLYVDKNEYKIIDWKDGIIRAKYSAPVADFELRISIKDSMAERSWRETKARGVMTSNPKNYENWILE